MDTAKSKNRQRLVRPLALLAGALIAAAALSAPANAAPADGGQQVTKNVAPSKAHQRTTRPVVTNIAPRRVTIGKTLTIRGRNFSRVGSRNTVVFLRHGKRVGSAKAKSATTKRLTVTIPAKLERRLASKAGARIATHFQLRVVVTESKKAGKRGKVTRRSRIYTSNRLAPVIAPRPMKTPTPTPTPTSTTPQNVTPQVAPTSQPVTPEPTSTPGPTVNDYLACDGTITQIEPDNDNDGTPDAVDPDDDNDLLPDTQEKGLRLNPCDADSDGDGVEDGYEYQSALDLNNDDYQEANQVLPSPDKRPYANPLYQDADVDYDGDGLTLKDEFALWQYTYQVNHTAERTLTPLSYSDGEQYSLSTLENGTGRRQPTMTVTAYTPPQSFRAWADLSGYGAPQLFEVDGAHVRGALDLFDADRDGVVTTVPSGDQMRSEQYYWNLDNDNWVSDDERDEDSDGLTNWDEAHGRLTSGYWKDCYSNEAPYPVQYPSTSPVDSDSDGDGVRDGADDQDFDDVPNVMELSRNMAGNRPVQNGCFVGSSPALSRTPHKTYVNPFNPCLPDVDSRTCQRHPATGQAYPPFDADWRPHVLN